MIEWSDIAAYTGSSLGGGGLVSFLMRGLLQEVKALKAEISKLKGKEFAEVKAEVMELKKRCTAETTAANQANILGWMKKIDMKLDGVQTSTDIMKGTVDGQAKWLSNINDAVQAHVTNYDIHSPKN